MTGQILSNGHGAQAQVKRVCAPGCDHDVVARQAASPVERAACNLMAQFRMAWSHVVAIDCYAFTPSHGCQNAV